ncbi:MAG: TonB-dependent receptor, partial [Deltaproteobacteria bacterium]
LNAIPAAIIERVEVLKDGASTIYGSDAIGGVVNLVTRRDFDGVEADAYLGTSQRGDGTVYDISVTAGKKYDKGHFLFSAGTYRIYPIWAGDRGFSKFDYQMDDWSTLTTFKGGSTATPQGTIVDYGEDSSTAWDNLSGQFSEDEISGYWYNDPTAGWRPFNFGGTSDVGEGDFYNYQPENYLVTPQERYNVYAQGGYQFHDLVRGFFEASYTNRHSRQLLAPEPIFTILEGITVSKDNYYNPFGRDFIDIRRRMVEGGNRVFTQDVNTFRIVSGFDGAFPEGLGPLSSWTWELSYNYGRTNGTNQNEGNYNRPRLANALGPSFRLPDGKIVCGNPGPDGQPGTEDDQIIEGCVPLNLFGGAGSITKDMLDYIGYTGVAQGFNQQEVVRLALSGDLVEIPFGGMMGMALGYEYREESGAYQPNPLEANGDTTGNKSEPTGGGYYVGEFYSELNIPLLADMPAVETFELNGSFRYSNYNTFGSKVTWKVGGRWQILPDVAIRGTYSTAFRAPTISQLYSGNYDDFPYASDPCDTSEGAPNDPVRRNCADEGIFDYDNPNFSAPEDQLRARGGGNPDLEPETADIITAGLVFTPSFLEGFSVTVDYWNLQIRNAIQRIGVDVILSQCYNREPGTEHPYCALIHRNPATKRIDYITDTFQNIGGTDTWGIDFQLRYDWKSPIGRWLFNFEGTYTGKYEDIQATGDRVNGQGVYDLELVLPDWRFNFGTLWAWEEFGAGFNLRFVGPFKECEDNDCASPRTDDQGNPREIYSRTVDPYVLVDLYVNYTLDWDWGTTRFTFGINNLFDSDPAVIYNGFTATSDPTAYDFMGRYFYGRITQTF